MLHVHPSIVAPSSSLCQANRNTRHRGTRNHVFRSSGELGRFVVHVQCPLHKCGETRWIFTGSFDCMDTCLHTCPGPGRPVYPRVTRHVFHVVGAVVLVSGVEARPRDTCPRGETRRCTRVHLDRGELPPHTNKHMGEIQACDWWIVLQLLQVRGGGHDVHESVRFRIARGDVRREACLCSNEGRSTRLSCRKWNVSLHAAAETHGHPREQQCARGHGKAIGTCNTCCRSFDPRCRHLTI